MAPDCRRPAGTPGRARCAAPPPAPRPSWCAPFGSGWRPSDRCGPERARRSRRRRGPASRGSSGARRGSSSPRPSSQSRRGRRSAGRLSRRPCRGRASHRPDRDGPSPARRRTRRAPSGPRRSPPGRTPGRPFRARRESRIGARATTAAAVVQLGLAMRFPVRFRAAWAFASGTTNGTSSARRNALELSTTSGTNAPGPAMISRLCAPSTARKRTSSSRARSSSSTWTGTGSPRIVERVALARPEGAQALRRQAGIGEDGAEDAAHDSARAGDTNDRPCIHARTILRVAWNVHDEAI